MGRGLSTLRHGRPSALRRRPNALAANSQPPSPWATPGLPQTTAKLQALINTDTDTFLRHQAAEAFAKADAERSEPGGGGRAFDEDNALFHAALYLRAAGVPAEDPQITTALRDLNRIRRAHIAMLEGPDADQTTILRLYGRSAHADASPRARRNHVASLSAALGGAVGQTVEYGIRGSDDMNSVEAATYRERIARLALNKRIEDLLCNGTDGHLISELIEAHFAHTKGGLPRPASLKREHFADYVRLARAHRTVDVGATAWHKYLHGAPYNRQRALRLIAAFSAHRGRDGDLDTSEFIARTPQPAVAADADTALTVAHGLLRDPRGLGHEHSGGPIRANVVVTAEAFAELTERLADHAAWEGIAPCVRPRAAEDGPLPYGLTRPASRHVHLGAQASLRCLIQGRDVQVRFLLPIEESMLRGERTRHARVVEHLTESAGTDIAAQCTSRSDQWGGSLLEAAHASAAEGTPVALSGREALLGPDRCRHEDASWHATDSQDIMVPPYAHLACPRCLRRQVATVPLHRLGAMQITNHERYLRAYRAQAAFDGEWLREDITLADLIARDQHISLDPTDHAHVPAATPASTPKRRRQNALVMPGARRT